jgi:trehalose 6-phosphate synthase/phosphatase
VKRLALEREICEWDFILCAGDDRTDEDMFKALRSVSGVSGSPMLISSSIFSVAVGSSRKKTSAGWHISSPDMLLNTLESLAELQSSEH